MQFRKATQKDYQAIIKIFLDAKEAIKKMGFDQWQDGNPNEKHFANDIKNGVCYVATDDGKIFGMGSLVFGDEPSYQKIVDGKWSSDMPYAEICHFAVNKE